ncbi:MAG: SagB/ThcOx family dehydrogenase [Bacillota bacterium]
MAKKTIGQSFLDGTKPDTMPRPPQKEGAPQPHLELPYDESDGEIIPLKPASKINLDAKDLREAIEGRKTHRTYAHRPITLDELTYALFMTQGVKKVVKNKVTFRTVPSAGARHPFETILLINNVEGLKRGLYRYLALDHKLQRLEASPDINQKIRRACLKQPQIEEAGAVFLWIADAYRTTYRYGERGYRYIFLDAGHVAQNLYLVAEQIGCGVCAIAAYDDDRLNTLLGLDGEEQFTAYVASLGKLE